MLCNFLPEYRACFIKTAWRLPQYYSNSNSKLLQNSYLFTYMKTTSKTTLGVPTYLPPYLPTELGTTQLKLVLYYQLKMCLGKFSKSLFPKGISPDYDNLFIFCWKYFYVSSVNRRQDLVVSGKLQLKGKFCWKTRPWNKGPGKPHFLVT